LRIKTKTLFHQKKGFFMTSKKILFLHAAMLLSLSACWNCKNKTSNAASISDSAQTQHTSTAITQIASEQQFETFIKEASKPVVVDFEAPWCGACKDLKPLLIHAATKGTDYAFVSINVDTLPNLGRQYNVTGIPTLLFIQGGKEIPGSRLEGPEVKTGDELLQKVKAVFDSSSSSAPSTAPTESAQATP
jgi:thioredoxin 1